MATDQLPEGFPQQKHAVVFGLYPGDPTFHTVVERAPEVTGAPGTPVVVAWLEPGVRHYVEYRNATTTFSYYRFRHAGFTYDFGEPTAWYRARPVEWNGEIPNTPREPLFDLDLALDGGDGTVDILANGSRLVKSIEWDFSTSTYPAEPTTTVDTDSEGDVTVTDAFTLAVGETGYVTVQFFDQVSGGGNLLGTLRASTTFGLSGFTVPTIQEVISESASQGTLTLTPNDPDLLITQVRFRTKVGKAAFGAWTAESVPAASYGPWTVALDPKHLSFIEYEVTYVLAGETEIIQSAIAYDTDKIPELLSLSAEAKEPGLLGIFREITVDWIGDSDVGSIRLAHSTTGFPNLATTQAATVYDGRTGTDVSIGTVFAVTSDVYISVLAYSEDDGTGAESNVLYQAFVPSIAGGEPTSVALILNCEFDEGSPGEGSYWATDTSSTGVAVSDSPAVAAGVDFQFSGDSQSVLLVQVTDDDDDITKSVAV